MGLERKLSVSVRLGFPINQGGGPRVAVLQIDDETSHIRVLEIELQPDELASLFGGSTAYVTARIPSRLDRVGKEMQHGIATWDDGYGRTKQPEAAARAEQWRIDNGWETVELHEAHGTWVARGRRWADPA